MNTTIILKSVAHNRQRDTQNGQHSVQTGKLRYRSVPDIHLQTLHPLLTFLMGGVHQSSSSNTFDGTCRSLLSMNSVLLLWVAIHMTGGPVHQIGRHSGHDFVLFVTWCSG